MNNEYILSVIREYADECLLREPSYRLSRSCFARFSYQKWAVEEILKSIEESKHIPPITVVESIVNKTNNFSQMNRKTNIIFSTVHEIATNIFDFLMAME